MRLLLDECTPKRLKSEFAGHDAFTADDAGLKGLKNGELLRAASGKFDVVVTVDQKMPFQQNPAALELGLIILLAKRSRYQELKALVPKALEALTTIKTGDIVRIQ